MTNSITSSSLKTSEGEYQVMAQIDGKGYEDAAVQWFNAVEKYYD